MGAWRTRLLFAMVAAAALAAGLLVLPGRDPAAVALASHLTVPALDDTLYPRYAEVLRARAWLASAPGMDEGVAPFTALPDATFGPERIVEPGELRAVLALLRGRTWDGAGACWRAGDGGSGSVPQVRVLELLKAALATPRDAVTVAGLLNGRANPGVPDLAALLRREPNGLRRIRLRSFAGERGRLLVDLGRPPFHEREDAYEGYLACFEGDGWPSGWRVLVLDRK